MPSASAVNPEEESAFSGHASWTYYRLSPSHRFQQLRLLLLAILSLALLLSAHETWRVSAALSFLPPARLLDPLGYLVAVTMAHRLTRKVDPAGMTITPAGDGIWYCEYATGSTPAGRRAAIAGDTSKAAGEATATATATAPATAPAQVPQRLVVRELRVLAAFRQVVLLRVSVPGARGAGRRDPGRYRLLFADTLSHAAWRGLRRELSLDASRGR